MYTHRYTDETTYQVVEYYNGGSRIISHDQHDYLAWVALGNIPAIEAGERFLSVVDGVLVVDPNKASILAAEEVVRLAEVARREAKAQAIIDNLPSWAAVEAAVDKVTTDVIAATTLAMVKPAILALIVIVKKSLRVQYWLAKDKAD